MSHIEKMEEKNWLIEKIKKKGVYGWEDIRTLLGYKRTSLNEQMLEVEKNG